MRVYQFRHIRAERQCSHAPCRDPAHGSRCGHLSRRRGADAGSDREGPTRTGTRTGGAGLGVRRSGRRLGRSPGARARRGRGRQDRLIHRFCRDRGGGTRVLWGACEALFTPRPLGPFLDVAEALGGELGALAAAGALPHEVASALVRELAGGPPAILVVEDAHWADEATLDVLRLLSRRQGGLRALLVVSYRDDSLDRTHPLRTLLGEIATVSGATRIAVAPLSPTAVEKLAEGQPIDPAELYPPHEREPVLRRRGARRTRHGDTRQRP